FARRSARYCPRRSGARDTHPLELLLEHHPVARARGDRPPITVGVEDEATRERALARGNRVDARILHSPDHVRVFAHSVVAFRGHCQFPYFLRSESRLFV